MNKSIVMIAAGMKKQKKDFMKNNTENIYLNYGLLGLATILYDKGYDGTRMFQGDNKGVENVLKEIVDSGINLEILYFPVLISVPSFFSVPWALEFIEKLKFLYPEIKIVLGGRWVIDNNIEWVKSKFNKVDFFCQGCADEIIELILYHEDWKSISGQISRAQNPFPKLNYKLLNNYRNYQPSIEVCRGCGRMCEFCLEKDYPMSGIKSPQEVIWEMKEICESYECNELNVYFEASIFNPSVQWAESFMKHYNDNKMSFKWRFETRVDSIDLRTIEILSKAGLKVIDLGLESASPTQLMKMGKTTDYKTYLDKAEKLIKKMHDNKVWAKLNILLYIGETKSTIEETTKWLDKNANYFKGVSVNPMILYLNGCHTEAFIKNINTETSFVINEKSLYENGYTFIDLSSEICCEEAKKISRYIAERYMTEKDYLDLKNICYTKREV